MVFYEILAEALKKNTVFVSSRQVETCMYSGADLFGWLVSILFGKLLATMTPLTRNEIRSIVEKNYNNLISEARRAYYNIPGTPHVELANEAIVSLFDVTKDFYAEPEVFKFLCLNMQDVYRTAKANLSDKNFLDRKSKTGDDDYTLLDKGVEPQYNTQEFLACYDIIEKARWGDSKEKMACPKCGCKTMYELNTKHGVLMKCKACRVKISFKVDTYLKGSKLTYATIIRACHILCDDTKTSSYRVAAYIATTQPTAYHLKRVINGAITATKSKSLHVVLAKLFTSKKNDPNPIVLPNKIRNKLKEADIITIRRNYDAGLYTPTQLAKIFNYDVSGMRKICKRELYVKEKRNLSKRVKKAVIIIPTAANKLTRGGLIKSILAHDAIITHAAYKSKRR